MTGGLGFSVQSLVGRAACEGSVGSIVVVVVLPLVKLVVEEVDVVDELPFDEPVEFFRVDPMGAVRPSPAGTPT
jgi:hypothetical protein